jgi:hypothetical protein
MWKAAASNGREAICYSRNAVIDPSKFPTADDEYTPEQRRMIDAAIEEGQKGPYYGPFKNGEEVAAFHEKWKAGHRPPPVKKTG